MTIEASWMKSFLLVRSMTFQLMV